MHRNIDIKVQKNKYLQIIEMPDSGQFSFDPNTSQSEVLKTISKGGLVNHIIIPRNKKTMLMDSNVMIKYANKKDDTKNGPFQDKTLNNNIICRYNNQNPK